MQSYKKKLIERYKKYMKENHDYFVDNEEAQIHLESLATLFLSFKKPAKTYNSSKNKTIKKP